MKDRKKVILIPVLALISIFSQAMVYNVRTYGAKGDGKTLDSPAINKAIESASKAGGGTVYFPAGTYCSYSIRLKDNIHLYFSNGAVLLAAQPRGGKGYDPAEPSEFTRYQDFGHSHFQNSLIWGSGVRTVRSDGYGTIYGDGLTREESRIPGVGNQTITDGHFFCILEATQRIAGFQNNGVIPRGIDAAVGDTDIPATVNIKSIPDSIYYNVLNAQVFHAGCQQGKMTAMEQRYILNIHIDAFF